MVIQNNGCNRIFHVQYRFLESEGRGVREEKRELFRQIPKKLLQIDFSLRCDQLYDKFHCLLKRPVKFAIFL